MPKNSLSLSIYASFKLQGSHFLLMRKVSSSISSRASFSQYFHKLFSYHTVARIQPLNPPVLEIALPDLVIEPNHLLKLYIQDLTEVLIDIRADEVPSR